MFSPVTSNPIIVSGGWDKLVKVWNLTNCKLKTNLVGHTGYINTVTVSPDGSLCASGKDGVAMLWDLAEGKRLYSLDAGDIIPALCFHQPLLALRGGRSSRSGTSSPSHRRRAQPEFPGRQEVRPALLHLPAVVRRRRHPLHGVHRLPDPRLDRQPIHRRQRLLA